MPTVTTIYLIQHKLNLSQTHVPVHMKNIVQANLTLTTITKILELGLK
jgi:hypothetical protein